jgi:hypothetical protein
MRDGSAQFSIAVVASRQACLSGHGSDLESARYDATLSMATDKRC